VASGCAQRTRASGDVVPTSRQNDALGEPPSSAERAVAVHKAEVVDHLMDALAARIGERVISKLSRMTDPCR
jgi:hypothetical protein